MCSRTLQRAGRWGRGLPHRPNASAVGMGGLPSERFQTHPQSTQNTEQGLKHQKQAGAIKNKKSIIRTILETEACTGTKFIINLVRVLNLNLAAPEVHNTHFY